MYERTDYVKDMYGDGIWRCRHGNHQLMYDCEK